MQHTIDANFTPASFSRDLLSAQTIEHAFEAIEARVG
jgi:hypothetical protein